MERFSAREHLLVGHTPRRSFGSPKLTPRNSDLDFNDVFGGPPRRSSLHEWRPSLGESMNSNSSSGGGGEEEEEETVSSSRNPWSGLSEKPVFGEENLNRRSNPSNDFFDDIFRGDDQYSTSTPTTKPSRDPFFSSPSFRALSPSRPLPPQSEPFGGSSLPISLSLPTKLAKGIIDQSFASPTHSPFKRKQSASSGLGFPSSPNASNFSNQVVEGRDDLRNDSHPFFGKSRSSREPHLVSKESSEAIKMYKDKEDYSGKNSSRSEINNNNNIQFHFSIYKWVSKGVPLAMMPLQRRNSFSSKGRDNIARIESELSGPVSQGIEYPSVSDDMSAVDKSWECENQDKSSDLKAMKKDSFASSKFIVEVGSAKIESEPVASSMSHSAGKGLKPDSVASGARLDIGLCGVTEKDVLEQSCTVELRPLYSVFKDESNRKGNDKIVKQAGVKEAAVERIDASVGKTNLPNLSAETSSMFQKLPTSSEDKQNRNKVKGKVKDFVKIFNQEAPSKLINVKSSQSTGVKDVSECKIEDEASVLPPKADEKEKVSNMKNKRILTDTLVMEGEISDKSGKVVKPGISINKTPRKIDDTSYERNDASASYSVPNILEAAAVKLEESHYEDLQGNCLVEELSPEPNKILQTSQYLEEIQASDARIRKWSNGKQGNIRSLLSTLQYVLWPESGWKPVPLVDIIEGNAVKRAYQKALLCLHPDKLQQKGAAPHQKYIAEKVFDILQDAWTHFNLLGSF